MSRNLRILTKPNDGNKYVKIKLEQSFDFLEILSLRLTQADVYRKFAADYGVIVGRVIANGGFGVPNAKVSVFIPLDSNEDNPLIRQLYPYEKTSDVNSNGIRYNILEDSPQRSCHVPVGTFPNKRKLLDNDIWLEIYDKYYKFTTSTNFAGDFMIFGVPTGNQNIHMDVDLSNIDYISLKPYDLIEQGYTETLFESKTTFKSGTDLGSLVQIQSKDTAVNILPFWGDLEENEVGINRVDFVLNTEIIPNATFFGSIFTDSKKSSVRKQCQPRETLGKNCDLATGQGNIEMIRRVSNTSNEVEFIQIESKQIDENGNWAFTIPMNLNKFITDEVGNLVPSEDPNVGIATTTKVRFRMAINEHLDGFKFRNAHYLVPNMYNNYQFGSDTEDFDFFEMRWKKVYTVTNYIPRYQKAEGSPTYLHTAIKDIGECENTQSFPFNRLKTNPTFFFTILCIFITVFAIIIDLLNRLIGFIIFEIIIALICFVKHPFSNKRQSACRCKGCLDLNSGLQNPPTLTLPAGWNPSCTDCIECAVCYNGDDSSSSSYSFKETTTLVPPDINILPFTGVGTLNNGTYTVIAADFSSILPTPTQSTYSFKLVVSGGVLTNVYIINQRGLGTQPSTYSTIYTLQIDGLSLPAMFTNPLDYVEFTLEPKDIIILNDVNDAAAGTYSVNDTQYTYTGSGQDVTFQATINSDGQLGSINIQSGDGGSGYLPYFDILTLNETFSLPVSAIGGVGSPSKLIAFSKDAFQTTFVVDGYPVDCDAFDISICKDECKTCPVSIIKLECNDFTFENIFDWADCVKESLAEGLGLIKYHFYNDWVIGSLYSVLFDYKTRFKENGKSVERFCDYDCRAPNVDIPTYCPTTPVEKDPNYKHRRNRCNKAYIAESFIFNDGEVPHACSEDPDKWEVLTIDSPNNQPTGRGLIIEYKGLFYYAARHDIEINFVTNANLNANKLTVLEKNKLLFATNIIELGSMVSCDRDGEPLVVNNLESTTYQKDNGIGVLYDYSDCFTSCPINRFGTQLMCQAGVEIAFAEISDNPTLVGDDGNDYVLMGNEADIPDYDENNGIIIFDRDDIILRRLLCENFDYYGVSRTYVSTEVPIPPPPYPTNPAYLEEVSPDVAPNDTLEFTTDQCIGFDDYHTILIAPNEYYAPARDMPPYYMYFGIRQGQSSLDKLRKNYFDRCID